MSCFKCLYFVSKYFVRLLSFTKRSRAADGGQRALVLFTRNCQVVYIQHGRMGVNLFGGAQYSLPEQANLTLIFFPKIVGERGGGEVSPKFFSRHTPKKFSGTNIQQNFPDIAKKFTYFSQKYKNFFTTSKFSRNLYVLPEFRSDFCPTVKIWGGGTCPPCPPGPYAYVCMYVCPVCHIQPFTVTYPADLRFTDNRTS